MLNCAHVRMCALYIISISTTTITTYTETHCMKKNVCQCDAMRCDNQQTIRFPHLMPHIHFLCLIFL